MGHMQNNINQCRQWFMQIKASPILLLINIYYSITLEHFSMNPFILQQGQSNELQAFPHILEFALKKIKNTQLNSLNPSSAECLRIYFVLDGKFEWIIDGNKYNLYPGDLTIILPGQVFGSENHILNIGALMYLNLKVDIAKQNRILLGEWSKLTENENAAISKILLFNSSA